MSYSEDNTFEKIMTRMLSNDSLVNVDKRVGSVIYDAIAPCALELADAYVKMDILEAQTFLLTATGAYLDKRVYDYGISRTSATQALRIGEFKKYKTDTNGNYVLDDDGNKILVDMDIPDGSRFTVPENSNIVFEYIGVTDGYKILQCESAGIGGNEHLGTILPLTPINKLIEAKITSTYKYGEDEESDNDLRERAIESLNKVPFGGNIEDYIVKVNAIDGVGNTKVFPAWQYNGSVLLSIVDPQYNPITTAFQNSLKEQIDPNEYTGQGVGIAPIGHYVTITTPVRQSVDVKFNIELRNNYTIETVQEDIEEKIEEYFESVRENFGQNNNLTIYRSDIIVYIKQLDYVINVTDVQLNGLFEDIVYVDEDDIGKQYLPYMGVVTIE